MSLSCPRRLGNTATFFFIDLNLYPGIFCLRFYKEMYDRHYLPFLSSWPTMPALVSDISSTWPNLHASDTMHLHAFSQNMVQVLFFQWWNSNRGHFKHSNDVWCSYINCLLKVGESNKDAIWESDRLPPSLLYNNYIEKLTRQYTVTYFKLSN